VNKGAQIWEYEADLIGGLIAFPGLIPDVARILTADDLDTPKHARLYRLLPTLPGGLLPMLDHLAELDHAARHAFGGIAYVLALPMRATIPELVDPLARRLRADAIRRHVAAIAQNILVGVEAGDRIPNIIRDAERSLTGVRWKLAPIPSPKDPA